MPARSATTAMMSSGRLPKVAFSRPPEGGSGVAGDDLRALDDELGDRDDRDGGAEEDRRSGHSLDGAEHDGERREEQQPEHESPPTAKQPERVRRGTTSRYDSAAGAIVPAACSDW